MGHEQAQLLQQEDFVVLSAVLHEAHAVALASSTLTADGDVELSLLEVCMRQCPHPRCARARPAPVPLPARAAPHLHRCSEPTRPCCQHTASLCRRIATTTAWCYHRLAPTATPLAPHPRSRC